MTLALLSPHRARRCAGILCALSCTVAAAGAQSAAPRRIWAGPVVDKLKFPPSLSPDAGLLAFADMATGELSVREVAAGKTRELTSGAWGHKTGSFASFTAFSRDGRQVAYEWFNDSNPSYELRVIGVDGSAPRVLRHPPDKGVARPHDWTPDALYIAATVTGADRSSRLELVPTSGGAPRLLKTFPDWRHPEQVRVSPDGRSLAYDCPARRDAIDHHVFVLAVDGSRESEAIAWPGDARVVGWLADGRLAFTSEHGGSPAIWTVRVANGVSAEPSIARQDLWSSVGLQLTANGTYFYSVSTGDRDVFSAAFDPVAGELLSKPEGLTQHPGESYSSAIFSPDGRSVAYLTTLTQKITYSSYSVVGGHAVTIQSLDGGARREMRPKVADLRALVYWGPNDKSIFALARDEKGRDTLQLVDLRTGEATVTALAPSSQLSADAQWRFLRASPDTSLNGSPLMRRVVKRRTSGGEEQELYAAPAGHAIDTPLLLSPDRRWLVFGIGNYPSFNRDRRVEVLVVPALGGPARQLLPPEHFQGHFPVALQFTPDGRSVLLMTIDPPASSTPGTITRRWWLVPLEGGDVREVVLTRPDIDGVRLSPDGRRIIFSAGRVATELWVVEEPALGFGAGGSTARPK